jgi:two-component system, OmpR family, KDP operon response regulator KdpE
MSKRASVVLIIDDEDQIRRFIAAGLALYGYVVREADTAIAGLKAAADMQPELIILDLSLPDADGLEVLRTIRSWSYVPVIVLSIHSDENVKVHLLKSGADDYVVKPFWASRSLQRVARLRCAAIINRTTGAR